MKVIINRCYGGFGLSEIAMDLFEERTGIDANLCYDDEIRDDPRLVEIVEELGENANGMYAKLEICEVPEGYDYIVSDYDGIESLYLKIKEDYLRQLIRKGNEDDIVNYVMNAI